jgi:hypothetical protein
MSPSVSAALLLVAVVGLFFSCGSRGSINKVELAWLRFDKDRCEVHRLHGVFHWTAEQSRDYKRVQVGFPEVRGERVKHSNDDAIFNSKLMVRNRLYDLDDIGNYWPSDQCYEFLAPTPMPSVATCVDWEAGAPRSNSYGGRFVVPQLEDDVRHFASSRRVQSQESVPGGQFVSVLSTEYEGGGSTMFPVYALIYHAFLDIYDKATGKKILALVGAKSQQMLEAYWVGTGEQAMMVMILSKEDAAVITFKGVQREGR